MGKSAVASAVFGASTHEGEAQACRLIARRGQVHYSEIRSGLRLSPGAWRRIRAKLLSEGRIVEVFPGMYELAGADSGGP
jgi:hypothetical protein